MNKWKFFWIAGIVSLWIWSCQKEKPIGFQSRHGSEESEDMNGNCLSCHAGNYRQDDAPLMGLGGTVFKRDLKTKNPNGYVQIYTRQGGKGTLLKEIEVDALGNFYMLQDVPFADSVYATVVSESGVPMHMSSALPNGDCNSCHGKTTHPIFAD